MKKFRYAVKILGVRSADSYYRSENRSENRLEYNIAEKEIEEVLNQKSQDGFCLKFVRDYNRDCNHEYSKMFIFEKEMD